jgi:hypothetical protein
MILTEEKYKAVPKNYKGIVRVKPSKAYPSRYWRVYAKLERGYRYTGNPGHSVIVKLYKSYQDLTNNGRPIGGGLIPERRLYVPRERKNNYW